MDHTNRRFFLKQIAILTAGAGSMYLVPGFTLADNAVYFDTTEWHDSINGLNCEHDWKQSRNFTTGSGAHVWAIVEGLFGLQRTINGDLSWQPEFPGSWKDKKVSIHGIRRGEVSIQKMF